MNIRGPLDAALTLLEYGDYECPHCTAAYPVVNAIKEELGDQLCFAYRHFPLMDIHPDAEPAAEAAEAAGARGWFWEMHDVLYENSPNLAVRDLIVYAEEVGVGGDSFVNELRGHLHLGNPGPVPPGFVRVPPALAPAGGLCDAARQGRHTDHGERCRQPLRLVPEHDGGRGMDPGRPAGPQFGR